MLLPTSLVSEGKRERALYTRAVAIMNNEYKKQWWQWVGNWQFTLAIPSQKGVVTHADSSLSKAARSI